MQLIEKYLGEGKETSFNKANFMKIVKSGKGLVVYGTGGGMSDSREIGFSVNQIKKAIEKGKVDMLFKNAQAAVKSSKFDFDGKPYNKARKFMVRMD